MATCGDVPTLFDRRLASAVVLLAIGIGAVVVVERLQRSRITPFAAYARWWVAAPIAQTLTLDARFSSPLDTPAWLLPDLEACR